MKNAHKIYIIEGILILYIILYEFVLNKYIIKYAFYINIIFWILFTLFLIYIWGFPIDKHYLKKSTIRTIILTLLTYFVCSYLIGMFTGFFRTIFSLNIKSIIDNILPLIINIIFIELSRYLILRKQPNIKHLILLNILFILVALTTSNKLIQITNSESIFIYVTVILLPIIARELMYTFLTNKISFVPTLIYHIAIECYIYVVPILPSLGNYLSSIIGIILPYLVYKTVKKRLNNDSLKRFNPNKILFSFFSIFTTIFLLIIVILISGILKYKMIGIASNSMNPIYYRGDAVIYKKISSNNIKKGDILVFKDNNKIITHRVIGIYYNNNSYIFKTKGDNNNFIDYTNTTDKDVLGVVKYIVKYIAYPSVFITEKWRG